MGFAQRVPKHQAGASLTQKNGKGQRVWGAQSPKTPGCRRQVQRLLDVYFWDVGWCLDGWIHFSIHHVVFCSADMLKYVEVLGEQNSRITDAFGWCDICQM